MKININQVQLKISAGFPKQFPRDVRPQIAFSGRSNVGKSSLINSLLGRRSLARVSGSPGKTITINFYDVDGKLYFVDLPGYGYAKRAADNKIFFSSLTENYFVNNPDIDLLKLVFQLIDVRVGPTDDDIHMINFMIDHKIPFRVVATKCDKLSKTALAQRLTELEGTYFLGTDIKIFPHSSQTGEGKNALWDEIYRQIEG